MLWINKLKTHKKKPQMGISFRIIATLCFFLLINNTKANLCVRTDVEKQQSLPVGNRWAIVALARPGRSDIDQRNKLIAEKLAPYSKHHNITVIFFSEKVFTQSTKLSWINTFKGIADVRIISTYSKGFNLPERFGYKYMCKFFSLDMYDYLRNDYDYYMRCDTDCYLNKVNFDILKWAEDNNVGYGFAMRKLEAHKPTAQTLPNFSLQYIQTCNIQAAAVMDMPLTTCFNFYNNWHIGSVSFFNRADVRHFLEAVNSSGHILSHRWGDSTIQAYAVRLFLDPSRILQVPNFTYVHGSHGNKLVSTFGDGAETNVPQRLPNWKYTPPN